MTTMATTSDVMPSTTRRMWLCRASSRRSWSTSHTGSSSNSLSLSPCRYRLIVGWRLGAAEDSCRECRERCDRGLPTGDDEKSAMNSCVPSVYGSVRRLNTNSDIVTRRMYLVVSCAAHPSSSLHEKRPPSGRRAPEARSRRVDLHLLQDGSTVARPQKRVLLPIRLAISYSEDALVVGRANAHLRRWAMALAVGHRDDPVRRKAAGSRPFSADLIEADKVQIRARRLWSVSKLPLRNTPPLRWVERRRAQVLAPPVLGAADEVVVDMRDQIARAQVGLQLRVLPCQSRHQRASVGTTHRCDCGYYPSLGGCVGPEQAAKAAEYNERDPQQQVEERPRGRDACLCSRR